MSKLLPPHALAHTEFSRRVYALCQAIPAGKVATYGQLAELAGSPGASRAVGMCMRNNPNAPYTPCHRVVASDGRLTGYSAGEGIKTKKLMLEQEGVVFSGEKVQLEISLWKPAKDFIFDSAS